MWNDGVGGWDMLGDYVGVCGVTLEVGGQVG